MSRGLEERLVFAHRLADAAGAAILPHFRQRIDVTNKGAHAFDPVTAADKGAESAMRDLIAIAFPQDGILGEEFGEVASSNGLRWVLDPLDGTRAFIAGQPMWGTLIALEDNGRQAFGIIDQPFLRERFTGVIRASGDKREGLSEMRDFSGVRTLSVRACAALKDATLTTTHPKAHFDGNGAEAFARVESQTRLSRYGGDCYGYALLAMGCIDLVIEQGFAPWDLAALVPVVEGAGGTITDWQGDSFYGAAQKPLVNVIAAGDARVHAQALALLRA
jgi:myo-inositol-1(or 4)-monophosphatase